MNKPNNLGDQKRSKISIIQTLLNHGPMARIELTRITDLSRATISIAIAELIDMKLVHETSSRYSTGGRPATLLELTPYSRAVVGADFTNQAWTLGAFDLMGNTVKETIVPVADLTPNHVMQQLIGHLDEFIQSLDIRPIEVIGLGLPGLVDINRGFIQSAADLGWYDFDAVSLFENAIPWSVSAINRHRARSLAECRFGAGKDFSEVIYIGIGTGIASGIFNKRQLIFGATNGAGELGHITIDPQGPQCPCGNQGCLQQLATAPFIEQEARKLLRSGMNSSIYPNAQFDLRLITAADICRNADLGDDLCRQAVHRAASALGIAMANLVNTLNPEAFILGGPVPGSCDYFIEVATQVMMQRALSPLNNNVKVLKATTNHLGGALGAAHFALNQNGSFSIFKE